MKRDITVYISIGLLAAAWLIGSFFETPPRSGEPFRWLYMISTLLALLGLLRAVALWIQTIRDIAQQEPPFPRTRWIIFHFIAPPITPYLYYYLTGELPPLDEPAEETTPSQPTNEGSNDHPEP